MPGGTYKFVLAALVGGALHVVACGDDDSTSPPGSPVTDAGMPDTTSGDTGSDAGPARPARPTVVAGGAHVCAILPDDTVRCWGSNISGELGNPQVAVGPDGNYTFDDSNASFPRPASVSKASSLALGLFGSYAEQATCAVLPDSTVSCWGLDRSGALGRGDASVDVANRPHPEALPVVGLPSSRQVATNGMFSCAVSHSGEVRCWGRNRTFVTGSTTPGDIRTPVRLVLPRGRTATAIVVGVAHACALLDDATVACWGSNVAGEIGREPDSQATPSPTPTIVRGLADVVEIGAGLHSTCARTRQGISCWGLNEYGELGRGPSDPPLNSDATPAAVALPSGSAATQLAVGYAHACATLSDGSLWCWGSNISGELGSRSLSSDTSAYPVQVEGLSGPVASVTAGALLTCAVLETRSVWCWGSNQHGALGQMHVDDIPHPSPLQVTF